MTNAVMSSHKPIKDYTGNLYINSGFLLFLMVVKYRLDTETKGSTRFRNPRALGCSVPSAARALLRAPRVSKSRRSHWSQCLTDLEYSSGNYASASVVNKITYESEVLFDEITDWLRVQGR